MNVSLSDEQLTQVIAAAVTAMLSPENREKLIKGGVVEVLSKKANAGYGAPTVFQQALQYAVQRVATDLVQEELQKEENMALMKEAVAKGVKDSMENPDVVYEISKAVVSVFTRSRSEY